MRLPLTLRLAYHIVRAGMVGAVILFSGWLAFVPATPAELSALNAPTGTPYPEGLRQMRGAQIILAVAPDRIYQQIGASASPPVPGFMVKLLVQQAAAGNVARMSPPPAQDETGPRFITVE